MRPRPVRDRSAFEVGGDRRRGGGVVPRWRLTDAHLPSEDVGRTGGMIEPLTPLLAIHGASGHDDA